MEVTDTVSVMRRGEMTATVKTSETNPEQLAELMVGRKVLLRVDKKPATPGGPCSRSRTSASWTTTASSGSRGST
jgi:general nucleoside transport system ATP-binding protein